MTFASPGALWALPVVLVPLAIHLLSRNRASRLKFGDNYLLKEAWKRARRRSSLRDAALLILRSAIMLLLVLAAAGPIAGAPGSSVPAAAPSGAREKPLSLLLWLDASYSMRYREAGRARFDIAREAGLAVLSDLRPWDRAAVAVFSDRLETERPAWGTPREAARVLRGVQPGFGTTDFSVPAAASAGFFEGAQGRRVALLLSDGAKHGFRADPESLYGRGSKAKGPAVMWLGLRWPEAANSYLSRARLEIGPGGPNAAARASGLEWPAEFSLWRESEKIYAARLPPSARGVPEKVLVPMRGLAREGLFKGRALLSHDSLLEDDEFFLSARIRPRPRALCVYGSPDFLRLPRAGYFLKKLCGGAEGSLIRFECDFVELGRFKPESLEGYQVALLADFRELGEKEAASLARFVREGGGLLIEPGEGAARLGVLDPLLPARLGPWVKSEAPGLKPGGSLGPGESGFWKGFDLGRVELGSFRLLQISHGAQVLLRSSGGYPVLVTGRGGAGRIAVWAASLDADAGNLALKPVFVPLMDKILGELSPPRPRIENFSAVSGRPLELHWDAANLPRAVLVASPSGRVQKLWPDPATGSLSFLGAREPGFYSVKPLPSGERAVYACNLDRSTGESDLSSQPSPPWKALSPARAARDFKEAVYGENLSAHSLAAALAALSMETLALVPMWKRKEKERKG